MFFWTVYLCCFTMFHSANWVSTSAVVAFFGLCGVFVWERGYMFICVCETFGSNDLMLFIKVGVKEEAAESILGLWLPIEAGCAPLLPHLVMKTSSITPLTGPWDVGQATLWGWSLWIDSPLHPHPSPLERERERGWKKTVYPSLVRLRGWQRKRHWCVMDRMDRIGRLHMVQGEVDGRCSVTADTAFHRPSVPWLMSTTSVDLFLPKPTTASPTSAAPLDWGFGTKAERCLIDTTLSFCVLMQLVGSLSL